MYVNARLNEPRRCLLKEFTKLFLVLIDIFV